MAKLPDPSEISRPSIAPSGGSFAYRAGTAEAAAADAARRVGSAEEEVGHAVGRFGDEVGKLMLREKQRMDELMLAEAENKLREIETKHSIEATKVKLTGVLEKDYIERLSTGFDTDADQIEATMKNREQRDMFQRARGNYKTSLLKTATLHAARETELADDAAYAGTKASVANYVAANPYNTDGVADKIADLEVATTARLLRMGVDPVTMKDRFDMELLNATGGAHEAVVMSFLTRKDVAAAQQYLDSAAGHMPAEKAGQLQAKMRPLLAAKKGEEIADQIIAAREQELPASEIKKLRSGLTPEEDDAVNANLRAYEHEQSVNLKRRAGTITNQFQADGGNASAQKAVLESLDFAELELDDPDAASDIRKFMTAMVDSGEAREESNAYREMTRRWKSPDVYKQVHNMMTDPNFTQRTPEELNALIPALGPDNVQRLTKYREDKLKGVEAYKIPKALIDRAMPPDIVSGDDYKDDRLAWLGLVQANLDEWRANNPGKIPTKQDISFLLRAANHEVSIWFGLRSKPLYAVGAEDREIQRQEALRAATTGSNALSVKRNAERASMMSDLQTRRKAAGKPPLTAAQQERVWIEYLNSGGAEK